MASPHVLVIPSWHASTRDDTEREDTYPAACQESKPSTCASWYRTRSDAGEDANVLVRCEHVKEILC